MPTAYQVYMLYTHIHEHTCLSEKWTRFLKQSCTALLPVEAVFIVISLMLQRMLSVNSS